MLPKDKKKICWDCGGEVPAAVVQCPFCGGAFAQQANESSFDEIPQAPYGSNFVEENNTTTTTESVDHTEQSRLQVIALSFLLPGITLLLLGIGIFFFADEGYLTLKWDVSYGLLIFLMSLSLIYFGARNYKKLKR